jgi:hypothetical protein
MPGDRPAGTGAKGGPSELFDYVVAYAKQETLDPVVRQAKALGRGIAGAFLLAIGTVLLAVGFVRALQGQFGSSAGSAAAAPASLAIHTSLAASGPAANPYGSGHPLAGDWSWVPYMGGALLCLLVTLFCVLRIVRGTGR